MDIEKTNTKMTIMKKKKSYIPPSSIAIKLDESLMLGIGSGKTKPEDSDAKRHVGYDVESEADGGGHVWLPYCRRSEVLRSLGRLRGQSIVSIILNSIVTNKNNSYDYENNIYTFALRAPPFGRVVHWAVA